MPDSRSTTGTCHFLRPDSPQPKAYCVEAWLDLTHTGDVFLRAGLRRQIGPEGDLEAAVSRWYAEHMREHDDALRQLIGNLHQPAKEFRDAG